MALAEAALHAANFNFEQEMNTTRVSGYRRAHYRSCDMKQGFLLVQIDEDWLVHRNVPMETWQRYLSSRDLEGFYVDEIRNKFPLVTEPL